MPDDFVLVDGNGGSESSQSTVSVEMENKSSLIELNSLGRKPKWHSILVPEDMLVAALQKSLLRSGQQIHSVAAYQAVRDTFGELHALLVEAKKSSLAKDLAAFLVGSDGSGGDSRNSEPPPNP